MNNSFLLKLSLVCSIVGVVTLYLILQFVELDDSSIVELDDLSEGTLVKVVGVVESVNSREDFTVFSISQNVLVDAVVFDSVNISAGLRVEVTGKLEEYNGKKELLVEKIILV